MRLAIIRIIACINLLMSRKLQQEQQGFFRSIPDINLQPLALLQEQAQRPFDYQPRVLLHCPIDKKLPQQMIEPAPAILIENGFSRMLDSRQSGSLLRGDSKSPHEKYADPSAYQLVYSKYKKQPFTDKEDCSARRQMELSSIVNYDPSRYVVLRPQKFGREKVGWVEDDNLRFDSRFQCGNLFCAYKSLKELNTYDCFIENDTNTTGYSQWFYFAIQNMKKEVTYRFNLVNMSKNFSFFKKGMKPTLFSTEKHKKEGNGWFQKGHNIKYKTSDVYDLRQGEKIRLFCLTFEVDFSYDHDYITVSHGPPYSYSRLIRQLKAMRSQAISNDIGWSQQTICHTVSNNQVPYLVISKGVETGGPQTAKKDQRKVIVIMARQHSGEINSSFVMEKILQTLASSTSSKVEWLLSKYQFRVFPMINVDGVIYGNFRCDLVGFDLNRCWRRPIKELQPQIFAIKKDIWGLSEKDRLACCIDLHSHSKQLNIFSYCNRNDEIESRLFSLVLSKQCPLFHFPSCTFGLSKEKETTARAVIGSLIPNQNAMTIECSSFGYKKQNETIPFSNKSYEDIGIAIMVSLKVYFSNSKYRKNMLAQIQQNLFKYRAYMKKNYEINSGSDSEPACISTELEKKLKSILPRDLLDRICKKAKEDTCEVVRRQHKSIEYEQQQLQIEQPPQIQVKVPKIMPKRNSFASIQQKNQNTKSKQLQPLSKRNIEKQVGIKIQLAADWKTNKIGSGRLRTEPRITHRLQRIQSNDSNQDYEVRYSTPSKVVDQCQNGFKNSMKILYRELRSNHSEEQYQSQLLINNAKEFMEKRTDVKNENKLETILKIRRKAHNFKSILSRERQNLQEVTLLKIRSEHASTTIETINHIISPIITDNSKLDRLIKPRQAFPRDRYNSHIAFLNKFLRSNIKQTLKPSQL